MTYLRREKLYILKISFPSMKNMEIIFTKFSRNSFLFSPIKTFFYSHNNKKKTGQDMKK